MPLSFAGIDLLLDWPDPDVNSPRGAVDTWLDRFAPLEDLRLFGSAPVAVADGRWAPRNPSKQAVGLATHNWSTPPRLRLNTLFWPATGASRWGYFVGLVDGARLDRIIAALDVSEADLTNKHGTLVISEGTSHRKRSISTKMYLLPPRRIAVDARAGSTKLWLLPLVDERYLWQMLDVGSMTASDIGSSTWAWSLLLGDTKLGALMPLSGNGLDKDSISADYYKPDALTFDQAEENAAVVLDSAAESVGMRVVRDFDGTVYLMAAARSETRLQNSLGPAGLDEDGYEVIAGGKADKWNTLQFPSTVDVMFPKWWNNGQYYKATINAIIGADTLRTNGTKVIYTTAEAEYDDTNAITNATACGLLATKITRDYCAWLAEVYDFTFAGFKEWQPNGFDDWLIYSHASCCPDRPGEPTLRVMSLPHNFGVEHHCQAFRFSASRGHYCAYSTTRTTTPAFGSPPATVALGANTGDLDGFTLATNEITVKNSGFYTITLSADCGIATSVSANVSSECAVSLQRDSGAGYATLFYLEATACSPNTAGSYYHRQDPSMTRLVRLEAGDKLKIITESGYSSTATQIPANVERVALTIESD